MSICSVVVFSRPEKTDAVRSEIESRSHCEVVAAQDGRAVVVIDTHDRQVMSDTIMALHDIDGVIGVSLVYEYFEPDDVIGNARADGTSPTEESPVAGEGCGCKG